MEVKDNIIHRPETSTMYDDMPSLGHMIVHNLSIDGNKTVIVDGLSGKSLSASDLVDKSVQIARSLTAAGIRQGDVVSIMSENRFEFPFVLFGTIFTNAILAPINNTYSAREIKHSLKLSKPKIVFASAAVSETVIAVARSLKFVLKVILLDDEHSSDNITMKMKDFLTNGAARDVNFELRPVDKKKTVCLIMCSSGTTGDPKGVQITHHNIIATLRNSRTNLFSQANIGNEEAVVLGLLPMFHAFGVAVLITTLATASGKIILIPKFEERTFLTCIEEYRCNVVFMVPPLMVFLAKNEIVDKYNLSSLRFILSGAAPLSKELENAVKDRLKNPRLVVKQGYGMTEFTVGVLCQKDIVKPGSVGDLNSGTYGKVIDEDGNTLGPHKKGELCFKGEVVMLGYINDEAATSGTIDKDGWLHTGDVGYYDEDLQFFIVDRIKELIKWKGFQVPPAGMSSFN
jgi:4-coumarate--CoA ligase